MDEFKWMAISTAAFIFAVFGSIALSDYQDTQVRLECIKQHGDYIGKSCVFRKQ